MITTSYLLQAIKIRKLWGFLLLLNILTRDSICTTPAYLLRVNSSLSSLPFYLLCYLKVGVPLE